ILRVFLRFRFKSDLNKINDKKDKLLIIANGPSFKNSLDKHPDFISGMPKMCVNLFALSPEYVQLKPEYCVIVDIAFFINNTIPRVKEATEKMIIAFKEKTTWKINLILPYEARGSKFHKELEATGELFSFIFFNRTKITGLRSVRHYLYRKNLGMPPPQNVLIASIMIALNMHYKQIYLMGADHSWHESIKIVDGNKMEIEDSHFYDKNENRKLVIQDPETQEEIKLHEFFKILTKVFSSHWYVEEYAQSIDSNIYNASEKSYIDAFEKIIPGE
ncbi:hypothetical protein ACFLSI_06390, partial [Bacteroidota bacterium]